MELEICWSDSVVMKIIIKNSNNNISAINADVVMLDLTNCIGRRVDEARESILQLIEEEEEENKNKEIEFHHSIQGKNRRTTRYILRVHSPEIDSINGFLDMELVGLLGENIEGVALTSVSANTYELIEGYIHPNHQLWAFFDSPLSIMQANEVCRGGNYHYAVVNTEHIADTLQLQSIESMHNNIINEENNNNNNSYPYKEIELIQSLPLLYSSYQVILAARAYGMCVMDGIFSDASDTIGFYRNLHYARALGFDGKILIRPSQISLCHEIFKSTNKELEWAREIQEKLGHRFTSGISLGKHDSMQWKRSICIIERYNEVKQDCVNDVKDESK